MKKIIILLASVCTLLSAALLIGCKSINKPLAYQSNEDGTLTVTGLGYCSNPEIVIPEEYNGKSVVAIKDGAFKDSSISSLTIPDTITEIGAGIVSGCDNLKTLVVPFLGSSENDTVNNYIGYFFGTQKGKTASKVLEHLTVSKASFLSDYALCGLRALTEFAIPEGVTSVGARCFEGCTSLASLSDISAEVTYVGYHAFNTTKLTKLMLLCAPSALQNDCLYGTDALEELTVDLSEKNILNLYDSRLADEYFAAVSNASFATSHTILPSTLKTIHLIGAGVCEYALVGSKVTTVTFAETISYINYAAFAACHSLTEASLPDALTIIDDCAFLRASKLESVTFGISLKTIGENAFSNCQALKHLDFSQCMKLTTIKGQAFQACSSLTDFEFPASLERLEMACFQKCSSLKALSIPAAVNYIGVQAFDGCSGLTSLSFVQKSGWKTVNGFINPDISNPKTNVQLITDTYVIYYWYRN